MDHLHHGNSRQCILQIAMCADGEMIADLDRVRPAEALLLDDVGNPLPRSQQEGRDSGWNGGGNLRAEQRPVALAQARHV